MALALSIIGIYGVISYSVSQRTREIGIRLALGAERNTLSWMFVRSALVMTGTGMVVGVVAAILLTRLMRSLPFGISPLDLFTYVMVPAHPSQSLPVPPESAAASALAPPAATLSAQWGAGEFNQRFPNLHSRPRTLQLCSPISRD